MKELLIVFDFTLWQQGSSWSSVSIYAIYLERMKCMGDKVEKLIVPYWYPPHVVKSVIEFRIKKENLEKIESDLISMQTTLKYNIDPTAFENFNQYVDKISMKSGRIYEQFKHNFCRH